MQDLVQAMLGAYADISALDGVPAFNSLAPPGVPFPYCVYSLMGGEASSGYGPASVRMPLVWQFSFYAVGLNTEALPKANDLSDACFAAFAAIKRLDVTGGLLLTLRPRLKRPAVIDSYIADPAGTGLKIGVYHALCQIECLYQQAP